VLFMVLLSHGRAILRLRYVMAVPFYGCAKLWWCYRMVVLSYGCIIVY
jgi:hypothetical protein